MTRYDYGTEADVVRIVSHCAELGASRILFQVRGNASVFFPSTLEPWSERLGGKSPGFDPLAVALREEKRRGLELEAWVNVMPLWKGLTPPRDPRHPYRLHPEWVVVGSDGKLQRLNEHYVCGNPARADFRSHVVAVIADLARRYPVQGVHLDYVRYVTDLDHRLDYSHDPVSLAGFGRSPAGDPAGWRGAQPWASDPGLPRHSRLPSRGASRHASADRHGSLTRRRRGGAFLLCVLLRLPRARLPARLRRGSPARSPGRGPRRLPSLIPLPSAFLTLEPRALYSPP